MHTSSDFILRGGNAAFTNRQKLLFDQLSIAESKCNKHERFENDDSDMKMEVEINNRNQTSLKVKLKRKETKKFRGRESIFKRPDGPAPRANCRNIPDYHKNPHKWTKYSLGDVSNEDMTERSNTQAAMSFLRELKARRRQEEINESEEKMDVEPCASNLRKCTNTIFKSKKHTSTSEIVFKKPQVEEVESSDAVVIDTNEKPVFRNSKIILPEYVIGQKPRKIRKHRPMVKVDHSKELRLDHLEDPDEEDN